MSFLCRNRIPYSERLRAYSRTRHCFQPIITNNLTSLSTLFFLRWRNPYLSWSWGHSMHQCHSYQFFLTSDLRHQCTNAVLLALFPLTGQQTHIRTDRWHFFPGLEPLYSYYSKNHCLLSILIWTEILNFKTTAFQALSRSYWMDSSPTKGSSFLRD